MGWFWTSIAEVTATMENVSTTVVSIAQRLNFAFIRSLSLPKKHKPMKMVWFWTSTARVTATMEKMRVAEEKLLGFATRFGDRHADHYEIRLLDTRIPRSVVPLKHHGRRDIHETGDNNADDYLMHGVHVESKSTPEQNPQSQHPTPLVLLHGYMNGSSYFYRNLVGLSGYFQSVYCIDMLGWGLSSRPKFDLTDDSVETAEDFFVESLEAWRIENKIDMMVLAGHSIGGYLSVAYCERYPQNVERLILLSPAGVSEESCDIREKREARIGSSLWSRAMTFCFVFLFERSHTCGGILRMLPYTRSHGMIHRYITRRLPAISESDEQLAVADYLYCNSVLPGSGEYCVNRLLTPFTFGIKPTQHRIPNLRVPSVSFLYGSHDWMDVAGGLEVQLATEEMQDRGERAPTVEVYRVNQAGHLLMLDNWQEFNNGVVLSAGGHGSLDKNKTPFPTKLDPHNKDHHQSTSPFTTNNDETKSPNAQVPVAPAS
jgi:cardiolipin-specific phospholipase